MSFEDRIHRLATSRHALTGITLASILESTIIPIPLETILIPLLQSNRSRLWRLATGAVIGCIIGAALGYGVGYFFFETIGRDILYFFGERQIYHEVADQIRADGFWFVLTVGITPVPFQVAMIGAGMVRYSFWGFLLAAALSRSLRYHGVALLVWLFGNKAEEIYHRHRLPAMIVVTILVIGLWILHLV